MISGKRKILVTTSTTAPATTTKSDSHVSNADDSYVYAEKPLGKTGARNWGHIKDVIVIVRSVVQCAFGSKC